MAEFCFIASRLSKIKFVDDFLVDADIHNSFSILEKIIYGANTQYRRISSNKPNTYNKIDLAQLNLDIYYYIMVIDKLRNAFENSKKKVNIAIGTAKNVPKSFLLAYKNIKHKFEGAINLFGKEARNEYEHSGYQFRKKGMILEYGNMFFYPNGDISCHIGAEVFAVVKKEQILSLNRLWIEYIDVFIAHFTQNRSTSELLKIKSAIERTITGTIRKLNQYDEVTRKNEANALFEKLLNADVYLSLENIPLSDHAKEKIYSLVNLCRKVQEP